MSHKINNVYLVCRWGNDEEGPNGKDTLFLVAAKSHLAAATVVDNRLNELPHEQVAPKSNWICFIGNVDPNSNFNGIIKGPFHDIAAADGVSTYWIRENWQQRWKKISS